MFRKTFAKMVCTVAKHSAKASVQQSSDWYHYQASTPDGLKEWAEAFKRNKKTL